MSLRLAQWMSAFALLLGLGTAGASCTTYRPAVVPFAPPPRSAELGNTWDDVLAHPTEIQHEALVTGDVGVDASLLLDLDHPNAKGVKNDTRWVPVIAHLVRHPTRGDMLVDTGFDHSFAQRGRGNLTGLAVPATWFMTLFHQKPDQGLGPQLEARQAHVNSVFFTHLHVDHTAGVPDLPREIRFVAGPGTLDDSYVAESNWVVHLSHLDHVKQVEELDFAHATAMPPLGPSIDVLGDGSFWAISTPGHSRGHVSYVLNTTHGPILLVGDASHTRWGWEHDVEPGKAVDHDRAKQSLNELRAFVAKYPKTRVYFGHELAAE
ncbi:MAG: MBL fold metallo-hydrolase [Polyangiaceae bacterium]